MPECNSCGEMLTTRVNPCPTCGRNPSVQTITTIKVGLPATKKKEARKAGRRKMAKKQSMDIEDQVCSSCGLVVSTRVNLCPSCGLSPSVETITSVFDKSRRAT